MNMHITGTQRLLTSVGLRHEIVLLPDDKNDQRILQMRLLPESKLLDLQIFVPTRDGVIKEEWTPINTLDDLFNFLTQLDKIVPDQRLIDIAVQVDIQLQSWRHTWCNKSHQVINEQN